MLPTIKFNDQFCFERNEIEYVIAKRVLTAKLYSKLLATQELPKLALRIGSIVPEFLRNPVLQ